MAEAAILPIAFVAVDVASVIRVPFTGCLDLIDKIYTCICEAQDNDGHCGHIATQAQVVKATLTDLERLNVISDAVYHSVHLLERNLQKCEQYIDSMCDRKMSRPKDFLRSRTYSRDLQALRKDLDSACTTFTASTCSQLLLHAQNVPVGVSDSKTSFPVPHKPREFHVSKRAHNKVQLCWETPSDDPDTASRYVVQYRKRWGKWVSCAEKPTTTKLTITGLSADSKYWFRARAENRDGVAGRFSDEINVETKYSPLARGFMYTGAALGGFISAPVVAPAILVADGLVKAGKRGSLGMGEVLIALAPIYGTIGPPLLAYHAVTVLQKKLGPDKFSDNED